MTAPTRCDQNRQVLIILACIMYSLNYGDDNYFVLRERERERGRERERESTIQIRCPQSSHDQI